MRGMLADHACQMLSGPPDTPLRISLKRAHDDGRTAEFVLLSPDGGDAARGGIHASFEGDAARGGIRASFEGLSEWYGWAGGGGSLQGSPRGRPGEWYADPAGVGGSLRASPRREAVAVEAGRPGGGEWMGWRVHDAGGGGGESPMPPPKPIWLTPGREWLGAPAEEGGGVGGSGMGRREEERDYSLPEGRMPTYGGWGQSSPWVRPPSKSPVEPGASRGGSKPLHGRDSNRAEGGRGERGEYGDAPVWTPGTGGAAAGGVPLPSWLAGGEGRRKRGGLENEGHNMGHHQWRAGGGGGGKIAGIPPMWMTGRSGPGSGWEGGVERHEARGLREATGYDSPPASGPVVEGRGGGYGGDGADLKPFYFRLAALAVAIVAIGLLLGSTL